MSTQSFTASNARYRWVILGITFLTFFSYAVMFQSIPPILGLIIGDLGLSHAQAGLMMSFFALPGVFLAIPMGMLVDRYGPKNLIVLGLSGLVVGSLLVAFGRSFEILLLGRMIAGVGVGVFGASAQIIAQWFAGREVGLAMGLFTTAMPLGTIVSLNAMGAAAKSVGWQGSVLIGAAIGLVSLILFWALFKPAPPAAQDRQAAEARKPPFATLSNLGLPVWLLAIIWMLFNATVISFLTFAPDFFMNRGYSIEFAGFLASILMLASPPLAPMVGLLLDRYGREELFIGLGGVLLAYAIFSIASAISLPIYVMMTLALGAVIVPTPVFSLPAKLLRPQYLGTGFGILTAFSNFGQVVGPYLAGLAKDVTGSYQFSFYLLAFFGLLWAIITVAFYVTRRPVEAQRALRQE